MQNCCTLCLTTQVVWSASCVCSLFPRSNIRSVRKILLSLRTKPPFSLCFSIQQPVHIGWTTPNNLQSIKNKQTNNVHVWCMFQSNCVMAKQPQNTFSHLKIVLTMSTSSRKTWYIIFLNNKYIKIFHMIEDYALGFMNHTVKLQLKNY